MYIFCIIYCNAQRTPCKFLVPFLKFVKVKRSSWHSTIQAERRYSSFPYVEILRVNTKYLVYLTTCDRGWIPRMFITCTTTTTTVKLLGAKLSRTTSCLPSHGERIKRYDRERLRAKLLVFPVLFSLVALSLLGQI